MSDILVQVEGISKKFCRGLKRSLWYGVQDISRELCGVDSRQMTQLRRGEFWAIENASFELRRGECLGLIGPNGAGKSTLLKMLNGLIKPDQGRIRMRGRVGALIELGVGFHPLLTGRENIYINAAVLGFTKHEVNRRLEEIIDFAEIDDALDAPVRTYSSGMRVRLGFAVASVLETDVLLIDEVLAVGDIAFRLKCFNRVKELLSKGIACILVSHDVNNLSRVCTRGLTIDGGQVSYDGELAGAIIQYESSLLPTLPRPEPSPACPTAEEVKIQQVRVCNPLDEPCETFVSGDTVVLHVDYESRQAVSDSTIVVRLGSVRTGMLGSFTNQVQGVRVPLHQGTGSFAIRLPKIPFLAGAYFIRLSIYDATQETLYDNLEMACKFDISGPIPDPWQEFFTVRLDHEWPDAKHMAVIDSPSCPLDVQTERMAS